MEEEVKPLKKTKFKVDERVVVYKSPPFNDGEFGVVVDFDGKWSDKQTSYMVCPVTQRAKLEEKARNMGHEGAVDLNALFNLSRWVKEEDIQRATFDKPKWYQRYKYVLMFGGLLLLELGEYFLG